MRNVMLGLTSNGQPRRRKPNFVNWREKPRDLAMQLNQRRRYHKSRWLANYRRRAAANRAAGLTAHGLKPKRRILDLAWKALRSDMPPFVHVEDFAIARLEIYT